MELETLMEEGASPDPGRRGADGPTAADDGDTRAPLNNGDKRRAAHQHDQRQRKDDDAAAMKTNTESSRSSINLYLAAFTGRYYYFFFLFPPSLALRGARRGTHVTANRSTADFPTVPTFHRPRAYPPQIPYRRPFVLFARGSPTTRYRSVRTPYVLYNDLLPSVRLRFYIFTRVIRDVFERGYFARVGSVDLVRRGALTAFHVKIVLWNFDCFFFSFRSDESRVGLENFLNGTVLNC
jgi:hypothetical protein